MRQGIDIATNDPVLTGYFKKLDDLSEQSKNRGLFIIKQLETVVEKMSDEADVVWTDIENHLKAKGKLPRNYDKSKTTIHYDAGTGLIFTTDKEDNSNRAALAQLLKNLLH